MAVVEIQNLTRRKTPPFSYTTVAKAVLPGWDVSLVFVGPTQAQHLNKTLRKKTYVPNVLSYALSDASGEIVICLAEAARQAPEYDMDRETFVLYLFIHGLLHLKGWAHSGTMEECERTFLTRFQKRARTDTHEATHSDRNRHRDLPSKSGSR